MYFLNFALRSCLREVVNLPPILHWKMFTCAHVAELEPTISSVKTVLTRKHH